MTTSLFSRQQERPTNDHSDYRTVYDNGPECFNMKSNKKKRIKIQCLMKMPHCQQRKQ